MSKPLTFNQRRHLANLRIGCLKLRSETLRYVRPGIPYSERLCLTCSNGDKEVENEEHFLFRCSALTNMRSIWFKNLIKPADFESLSSNEKLDIVLNNSDNVKSTAKYIVDAFDVRSKVLF